MPPTPQLVIAIDGPSASGKSTTARAVARELRYLYVDTGAMYRALALKCVRENLPTGGDALAELLGRTCIDFIEEDGGFRVRLDGVDVTDEVRSPEVSSLASHVATLPAVRRWMVEKQREIARRAGGVVMEGRDIGTVVLPDADLKIYLDASHDQRAMRRWREDRARGVESSVERVEEEIRERDRRDMTREHSPLEQASDAVRIDTTELGIGEQVERVLVEVRRVLREKGSRGPSTGGRRQ